VKLFSPDYTKITVVILLLLLAASLIWQATHRPREVALAKGAKFEFVPMKMVLSKEEAGNLALNDAALAALLAGKESDFLYALPLGYGEAARWRSQGCGQATCAQLTWYDYTAGGTIEAVVKLDNRQVIERWANPDTRPATSPLILPRALAIAAADKGVTAVLPDIANVPPTMVPMSAWLEDDDCRQDWCVDLTFAAPDGSGRVLHVMVNMHQEVVARTFYTRGRPPHSYRNPAAQDVAFNDGCHEQYGWNLCWEMTGHDAIHFYGASFEAQLVFTSTKVSQVEVWYPSWPGGYRDELGFAASIQPYYGTTINDLGNGFEVRQLFSEFTRWPNCICCYRYEQAMRFFADGSFESDFLSHGPGCDDPSIYRPFVRIDMELNGPADDQAYYWQDGHWVTAGQETLLGLFDDLSPESQRMAVFDGDLHYRWRPVPTDPVGGDAGRLYLLRANPGEGDGPIPPGPANTFFPPQGWFNQQPLEGENLVIWYIPFMVTKKGGPWWCMPDPDPNFSPCNAVLRLEPAGEPPPELAPAAGATETPAVIEAVPTLAPTAEATATPWLLEGEDAVTLVQNAGCGACHTIGSLGEAGKVGPDLSNIGSTAGQRMPEVTAADYLRQSILDPNGFLAPECPNGECLPNIMPQDYGQRLSPAQIEILVAFLLEQQGQSAVTPSPLPPAVGATAPAEPPLVITPPADVEQPVNVLLILGLVLVILLVLNSGRFRGGE
jgi:cytochrome c551/c552